MCGKTAANITGYGDTASDIICYYRHLLLDIYVIYLNYFLCCEKNMYQVFSLNIFYCPIEAIQDCNTWLRSEKKVSDACGVMV